MNSNQVRRLVNAEQFGARHITVAEFRTLINQVFAAIRVTCPAKEAANFRAEVLALVRRELRLEDETMNALFGAAEESEMKQ